MLISGVLVQGRAAQLLAPLLAAWCEARPDLAPDLQALSWDLQAYCRSAALLPALPDRWLSVTEAAQLLDRTPGAVRARCRRGTLPAIWSGSTWRVPVAALTPLLGQDHDD